MDTISIWQLVLLVLAVAGSVALAVTIPLVGFGLAFRPWIQGTIKGEVADFKVEVMDELKEFRGRIEKLSPFERSFEKIVHSELMDKPNPPVSRKNELLEKWHSETLDYTESLELKGILEQESERAGEAIKAVIIIALIGLGLYVLTRRS